MNNEARASKRAGAALRICGIARSGSICQVFNLQAWTRQRIILFVDWGPVRHSDRSWGLADEVSAIDLLAGSAHVAMDMLPPANGFMGLPYMVRACLCLTANNNHSYPLPARSRVSKWMSAACCSIQQHIPTSWLRLPQMSVSFWMLPNRLCLCLLLAQLLPELSGWPAMSIPMAADLPGLSAPGLSGRHRIGSLDAIAHLLPGHELIGDSFLGKSGSWPGGGVDGVLACLPPLDALPACCATGPPACVHAAFKPGALAPAGYTASGPLPRLCDPPTVPLPPGGFAGGRLKSEPADAAATAAAPQLGGMRSGGACAGPQQQQPGSCGLSYAAAGSQPLPFDEVPCRLSIALSVLMLQIHVQHCSR